MNYKEASHHYGIWFDRWEVTPSWMFLHRWYFERQWKYWFNLMTLLSREEARLSRIRNSEVTTRQQ